MSTNQTKNFAAGYWAGVAAAQNGAEFKHLGTSGNHARAAYRRGFEFGIAAGQEGGLCCREAIAKYEEELK